MKKPWYYFCTHFPSTCFLPLNNVGSQFTSDHFSNYQGGCGISIFIRTPFFKIQTTLNYAIYENLSLCSISINNHFWSLHKKVNYRVIKLEIRLILLIGFLNG